MVKACCAATYGSDLVALLLGDSYHPGGARLTRRLAARLALTPGTHVVDVASGRGSTAALLAAEYGVKVTGIDLSAENVAAATEAASTGAGPAPGLRPRFRVGDAERLPLPDGCADVVVCECAFCTFPDKPAAAAEFARVLRTGGRLGLTDVTADPGRLPPTLTGLAARIACVADARPLAEYVDLLSDAGLRVVTNERHDDALIEMINRIEARLTVARMALGRSANLGVDLTAAPDTLAVARVAVRSGALGYGLLIAERSR